MSLLLLLQSPASTAVTAPDLIASPTTSYITTGLSKTSTSLTVQVNDRLVVTASSEDAALTLTSISDTNTHSWTLEESVVVASFCTVYIWTTTVTTPGTITITINANTGTREWGFTAYQWRTSDGIGVSAKTNISSGAPTLNLTTTQEKSAIVTVNGDWTASAAARTWRTINGTTPTSGNGFEKAYYNDAAAYTAYSAYWPDAGVAGTYATGLSAPTGQKYSIASIEVKGSTSAGDTPKTLTETATGTDALTANAVTSLTESSTSTDALTVSSGTPLADTGSGLDAMSVSVASALTEIGTGTDTLGVSATVSLSDVRPAATDVLSVAASIALSESVTAADNLTVDKGSTPKTLTDNASATDVLSVSSTVGLTETVTSVDALTVTVQTTLTEISTSTDALATGAAVSLTEFVSANDSISANAAVTLTDSAIAVDLISTGVPKALIDSATAVDSLSANAALSLSETAHGTDALAITSGVSLSESVTATDTLTVSVAVALTETATSADSLSHSVSQIKFFAETVTSVDEITVERILTTPGIVTGGIAQHGSIALASPAKSQITGKAQADSTITAGNSSGSSVGGS